MDCKLPLCLSALLLLHGATFELCVVTCDGTPVEFASEFGNRLRESVKSDEANVRTIYVNDRLIMQENQVEKCDLVLNAATDRYITTLLSFVTSQYGIPQVSLSPSWKITTDHDLPLFPRPADLFPCLTSVLRHFNWTDISLLYSPDDFSSRVRNYLAESFRLREGLISSNQSVASMRKVIIKEIKLPGANVVLIATSAESLRRLLPILQTEKMMRGGYGYLVLGSAVWELSQKPTWPGLLQLRESDCASAANRYECDADRVAALIRKVAEKSHIAVIDLNKSTFQNYFLESSAEVQSKFVLMNTQSDSHAVVAEFDAQSRIVQRNAIYFPGNLTSLPKVPLTVVEISFNSGFDNPTIASAPVAASFYRGQQLAEDHINARSDILPRHVLTTNRMSFGVSEWNATWATPRILTEKAHLGVGYMAGYASTVTMNTMFAFKALNVSRPVIGSSNSLIILGNSTAFPWFVRNGISDLYFAALFTNIMPAMGWKRCAVLYGDDIWGTTVYAKFKELADSRRFEISNNESLRRVAGYGTKSEYWRDSRAHLLELFRCNARLVIILILEPAPQYILELMFDLGARKGDFIFTGSWLSSNYITKGSALEVMKRRELLEGTVGFTGAAWIGALGREIKSEFHTGLNDSDPSPFACFYYDSTFALAHAIDTCVTLGVDYEDPATLMKFLRETRFVGCSGFISWLSGENNRAYVDYNILNLVRNDSTGNYSLNIVGRYSPTSVTVFNFTSSLQFADGTANTPSDLRVVFGDCPFEDRHLQQFQRGEHLTAGICSAFLGVTLVLITVMYKKCWKIRVNSMRRHVLSNEDVMFMATVGIEAAQLASLGPDFRSLNSILMSLAQMMTVDLGDIISLRNGVYWTSLNVIFGLVGLWTFLIGFTLMKAQVRFERFYVFRLLGKASYVLLPLLGNVCFVPITFILLDVFVCDHAVGRSVLSYTNSVLARDCFVTCWTGWHLLYASLAAVCLLVYVPLAILLRPAWQNYQESLHIETYPRLVAVKSIVQIALICTSKTLKRWCQMESGVVFVCIVGSFLGFVCKFPGYNYARVNLWHGLSLVGVLSLSIAALVNSTVYHSPDFRLVAIVVGCWAVLIGIPHSALGVTIQALFLPSLLYKPPGRDFNQLVKFAFTNRVQASEIQPQLHYANRSAQSADSNAELSEIVLNFH